MIVEATCRRPLATVAILSATILAGCTDYPPLVQSEADIMSLRASSVDFLCARGLPKEDIPLLERFENMVWICFETGGGPGSDLTDASVEVLMSLDLEKLDSVRLGNNDQITDLSLEIMGRRASLTALSLTGCERVTVAGLEHLRKLEHLWLLDLSGCRGIKISALELSRGFPALTHLDIDGCSDIKEEDVRQMLADRPGLHLQWRRE